VREISIAESRRAGVSEAAIQRTIVIEFGSSDCVFDAIAPEGYVIEGRWKLLKHLDERFK
jgi:hypothetical protein